MATDPIYGYSTPEIVYTEYYVSLVSTMSLAGLINPGFLQYNGIIPDDWQPHLPVIISQNSADIEYANGVAIRANDNEVSFAFLAEVAPLSDVELSIGVAHRFLGSLPGVQYESVMIDLQGYAMLPQGCPGIMNIGSRFHGILPVISHESVYTAPDHETRFYVQENNRANDSRIDCLDLRAHTTYSVPPTHRDPAGSPFIPDVLRNWTNHVAGFTELATNFIEQHIVEGGTE
jgi:hypothetical protein